jgi:hypothetical protein
VRGTGQPARKPFEIADLLAALRWSAPDAGAVSEPTARTSSRPWRLEQRIGERFTAGLRGVAAQLRVAAEAALTRAPALRRPLLALRAGAAALALLLLAGVITVVGALRVDTRIETVTDLVQTLESAVNDVVFVGIAIWFLATLEGRLKRRRALAPRELRSLAHVVDMHQLTKDPETADQRLPDTVSSPKRPLSRPELARYLDYCTEILALTGKVAALYAQHLQDGVVLAAVNEVETLTNALSRKIWQKISLVSADGRSR